MSVKHDLIDGPAGVNMPPAESGAADLLGHHAHVLSRHFAALTNRYAGAPARLMESIQYSLTAGGKRLRPGLVFECWRACRGTAENYPSALAAATAIELIHTFSLVHDDLPAMDDDDLRRGRPTNHKVFGEAMAILAGDAMVTMAFEIISVDALPPLVPALVRDLASASGPEGMIGGQVLDMDGENRSLQLPELQRLHAMKTGALLTAACRMGAIAAGGDADAVNAVEAYGRHLGLAFQIVDDLLDLTATPEQMGKGTGKDAGRGKNTYPSLMGLEESRKEAGRQLDLGLQSISPLGTRAQPLVTLARFVVQRDR
jgi:geranylgeranyl diphosphate synthase type II